VPAPAEPLDGPSESQPIGMSVPRVTQEPYFVFASINYPERNTILVFSAHSSSELYSWIHGRLIIVSYVLSSWRTSCKHMREPARGFSRVGLA